MRTSKEVPIMVSQMRHGFTCDMCECWEQSIIGDNGLGTPPVGWVELTFSNADDERVCELCFECSKFIREKLK